MSERKMGPRETDVRERLAKFARDIRDITTNESVAYTDETIRNSMHALIATEIAALNDTMREAWIFHEGAAHPDQPPRPRATQQGVLEELCTAAFGKP